MKYRIIIEQDEDGAFVVECPSLPGCISQGRTRKEAIENIQDAIRGYLESLNKYGEPIPPPLMRKLLRLRFDKTAIRQAGLTPEEFNALL